MEGGRESHRWLLLIIRNAELGFWRGDSGGRASGATDCFSRLSLSLSLSSSRELWFHEARRSVFALVSRGSFHVLEISLTLGNTRCTRESPLGEKWIFPPFKPLGPGDGNERRVDLLG